MFINRKVSLIVVALVSFQSALSQDSISSLPNISFSIGGEFKSRFEVRNGYRTLAPDDTSVAIFGNMRTRLNFDFKSPHVNAFISIQDARVYGEYSGQFRGGSINLFEGYAEVPLGKGFSAKVGRQRIMYDNQRLFAQNDWRVWARAHDAVRFNLVKEKSDLSTVVAFNQSGENNFGTAYNPISSLASEDYKLLHIVALTQKLGHGFTLFILHAADGFESTLANENKHLRMRYTDGGRIEWINKNKKIYITTNAYIQYGKTASNQKILAWYAQPEIKISAIKNITMRIGAELLSGQDVENTHNTRYNSFVPLYGVAHRFNGYMDLFTRFPSDTKNAGLLNPYLFVDYTLNSKISISDNAHYFASHHHLIDSGNKIPRSLGFENDVLFAYKPNKIIGLELGYSFVLPTTSLEYIKNTDTHKFNQWAYIQLTVKPDFFTFTHKK